MAFRAFAFLQSAGKLAVVNVFMAIHAVRERQGALEVSAGMTGYAVHLDVLAEKRIFRFGVIKCKGRQDFLPACRRVTFLASLLE